MTNEERAKKLAHRIDCMTNRGEPDLDIDDATKLILTYADEIRRECAEKAEKVYRADCHRCASYLKEEQCIVGEPCPLVSRFISAIMGRREG